MFCPQCGTEVADSASFCRKCGSSLRDDAAPPAPQPVQGQAPAPRQPVYQQPAPQQQVMTQQRATPQTMRHTLGAIKPTQPAIGIAVIVGSAIAVVGTVIPWLDFAGATANGFDGGYLTGSSMGDGNDGIVILLLGLAAGALAVHYFMKPNALLSLGSLVLGAAAAVVAGYNLFKLIADIRDSCGGCNVMDYLGYGLFATIVGGAIAAFAAAKGPCSCALSDNPPCRPGGVER